MWPLRRSAEVVGSGFEKEKITGALAAGVVLLGSLGLVWASNTGAQIIANTIWGVPSCHYSIMGPKTLF